MNLAILQQAITEIKFELETAIQTAIYNGKDYPSGLLAKEALIRSQNLILKVHEVVKISLLDELSKYTTRFAIYPPLGQRSPEMSIMGLLKRKKQDVVVLFDDIVATGGHISEGPLRGAFDELGQKKAEKAIVVGVRSQLSSINKNFDTLMERTFAETLNLRLRLPNLVMGDVYLLPVVEYNDLFMKSNLVGWKREMVAIQKFINTFLAISGRSVQKSDPEIYKYERVALILVDFRESPPKVFLTTEELRNYGFLPEKYALDYDSLSPMNFAKDIAEIYFQRHTRL